jgi:predicted DNA-binding ArsR family transcriptional regulator
MSQQAKEWEQYYEEAWNVRKNLAEQFVKLGLTDPFQIVQKINVLEGKYMLERDQKSAKLEFKKKYFPGEKHFFPTGKPLYSYVHLGEQLFAKPTYSNVAEFLMDYLDEHFFDAIVELGSGFGENLIELYYRGGPRNIPYYSAESTRSGNSFTEMLVSLNPDLPIKAVHFDYKKPNFSFLKEKENVLFFSSHSIEQVKEIDETLFRLMSESAKRVTCIHFEPFGFQMDTDVDEKGEASKLQEHVFKEKHWNMNFAPTLMSCHKKGDLKITFMAKNVMGTQLGNPTSMAIWEGGTERMNGPVSGQA